MTENIIEQFRTNNNTDKIRTVNKPTYRGYNPKDTFENRVNFLAKKGLTLGEIAGFITSNRFESKDDLTHESLTPFNVAELKTEAVLKTKQKRKH